MSDNEFLSESFVYLAGGIFIEVVVATVSLTATNIYSFNLKNQVKDALIEQNNIDDIELKSIKINDNFTVDFIGTKVESKNKQFGAFTYQVPHYSEGDMTAYENLINPRDSKYSFISSSTLKDLKHLVESETATWTSYTNEEQKQFEKSYIKFANQVNAKMIEDDNELTM